MSKDRNDQDRLADLRLLTLKEVREITGYSANHIYRLIRKGQFPQRIKLGANSVRWRRREIEDWIEKKEIPGPPSTLHFPPHSSPSL